MVNITTTKETEKESEKTIETTEKIENGQMNFEAVPCMFKSRQEDGAEGSLFGLLIRPAIASTTAKTELNNTILINNGLLKDDNNTKMLVTTNTNIAIKENSSSSTTLTNQPNLIEVLPACNNSVRGINQPSSVIFTSKMLQLQQPKGRPSTSLPFLSAPSGVPPILPRPKHHQQKKLRNLLLNKSPKVIPIQPKIAKTSSTFKATFNKSDGCFNSLSEMSDVQSPLHTPQIPSTSQQQHSSNNLSISTTSSISCSNNTLDGQHISPGLLSVHLSPSPKLATIKKCQKQKITLLKEKSSIRPQTPPNKLKKHQKRNKKIKQQNQSVNNSEIMLGEDLHEIDLSQLVNSTVITTEDYLPSQSEQPIYTNMDMYNTNNGTCVGLHQQSTSNNICQMQSSNTDIQLTQQQRILNFVENSNNQQQQQSLHSIIIPKNNIQRPLSTNTSSTTTTISSNNQQYNNNDQQQLSSSSISSNISTVSVISSSISQTNNSQGWHPYLVAHPGGSHISSTPDSGIQSIDGSPPSVYTPPMVSPYSSQVRSCESINLGGHGINLAFPISITQNNCLETFLQINNNNTSLPPQLIGQQQQNISENENKQNEENDCNEENEPSDFSDMPKLIPITNSQLDESLDGEENNNLKIKNNLKISDEEIKKYHQHQQPSTSNKSTKELLISQGMSLQELAECISSSIPPEQLKQLTCLIQSKALGAKEIQIIEKEKEIKKVATEINKEIFNNPSTSKEINNNIKETKKSKIK